MRTDILERKEDILRWIDEKQSKAFMCRELKCKQDTLNSYLKKMGIEYEGNQNGIGQRPAPNYIPVKDYIKNSYISSPKLKEKLIREGFKKDCCELCGLSEWRGVKLTLELHHKNGDHYINDLDNLMILCPNCHSIQESHKKSRNIYKQSK